MLFLVIESGHLDRQTPVQRERNYAGMKRLSVYTDHGKACHIEGFLKFQKLNVDLQALFLASILYP